VVVAEWGLVWWLRGFLLRKFFLERYDMIRVASVGGILDSGGARGGSGIISKHSLHQTTICPPWKQITIP